ncbi:MAG TPA: tripartite tricarboxylate transporter TctB family protein [Bosea sp. (in: a-proteobacteria)]|jgi:putative tricarboxylic transport membrane protein|uniref:tripartite tricarboxylate transporter TctB family protein n=1 Tax=Bosea sp. (in: a-proteobacteria) TaxID=1871050 RepID=UPI002E12D375|nr:tripartite tricarboxylate transporter TctB family protein [Bosea sp. (in: a-proteobacteria)]
MSLNRIEAARSLRIRSTQDFAAGLFMLALALLALFLSRDLPSGTLRQMGPGMLPKAFATICAVLGLLLSVNSLRYNGEKLTALSWRGIFFVLGAACLFGLTIRGFDIGSLKVPPLGMLVSGPIVVICSGLAAPDVRIKELLIFAAAMTIGCALLFKYALGLPIPLAPWLLGI